MSEEASSTNHTLVVGASAGLGFSIGAMMINLADVSPKTFSRVVIFCDDFTKRDKEILQDVVPADIRVFRAGVSRRAVARSAYLRYFTPHVLSKLECFRLLSESTTATWIDSDVVIRKPLDSLISDSKNGARFMTGSTFSEQLLGDVEGPSASARALFTGTFSLSKQFSHGDEIYKWANEFIERYANYLYLPEQAALTAAFVSHRLSVDQLDARIYAPHPKKFEDDAVMVHAYGPKKFWNGLEFPDWNKHYDLWVSEGGSRFNPPRMTTKLSRRFLKAEIRFRKFFANRRTLKLPY